MSNIEIRNISKCFGDTVVFHNFSCTLEAGSIYRLSAPSGTGKTTLLKMLAGLTQPDSGSICNIPKSISMVFQEDRLIEDLSIQKNIELVLYEKYDAAKLQAQLSEIGLTVSGDTKVRELSGGMKRRVAIVRALMHKSELVLLDEPFTGLDADTVKQAAEYILKHLDGRCCLVAGHIREPLIEEHSSLLQLK